MNNDSRYSKRLARLVRLGFKHSSDIFGGSWVHGRWQLQDHWVQECSDKEFDDELFAFGYYQDIVIHYDWEDKE